MSENDVLRLEYLRLENVTKWMWERNLKLHDIGAIVQSFMKYGFKDPMKFEPTMNDGKGGFVEGNGRLESLIWMHDQGDDPPRGIAIDHNDGMWLIPVLFGVDAESEVIAEAYGIDHNNLTVLGGDTDYRDLAKMWKPGFDRFLIDLANKGEFTISIPGETMENFEGFDWSAFGIPQNKDIRYRYVIDELDRSEAEEMVKQTGKGKVESYRVEE